MGRSMSFGCPARPTAIALALFLLAAAAASAHAQDARRTPREQAPIDITGYWVSLITEDWQFRMIMPPKGEYSFIPLNAEGRRVADTWDPARDEAAGEACRGYAAPAVMRLPGRLHVTWQDASTLRIDTDTGTQTRLFHFDRSQPRGERTWQGHSTAEWRLEGGSRGGSLTQIAPSASLKVDTTHLRAGYLRKNGVPFSGDAFMTEYFSLLTEDNGDQYLAVQTFVDDPKYLRGHYVRTLHFKRQSNGAGWQPTPCVADGWGPAPRSASGQ